MYIDRQGQNRTCTCRFLLGRWLVAGWVILDSECPRCMLAVFNGEPRAKPHRQYPAHETGYTLNGVPCDPCWAGDEYVTRQRLQSRHWALNSFPLFTTHRCPVGAFFAPDLCCLSSCYHRRYKTYRGGRGRGRVRGGPCPRPLAYYSPNGWLAHLNL